MYYGHTHFLYRGIFLFLIYICCKLFCCIYATILHYFYIKPIHFRQFRLRRICFFKVLRPLCCPPLHCTALRCHRIQMRIQIQMRNQTIRPPPRLRLRILHSPTTRPLRALKNLLCLRRQINWGTRTAFRNCTCYPLSTEYTLDNSRCTEVHRYRFEWQGHTDT